MYRKMYRKLFSSLRNVMQNPSICVQGSLKSIRSYSSGKEKSILEKVKDTWRLLYRKPIFDKVPPGYKMIYRSSMESYVDVCLLTGIGTVIFFPFIVPYMWKMNQEPGWKWEKIESFGYVIGLYGSMALLYTICYRCPQRMYYSDVKKHFLVFMPKPIPFSTKSVILSPGTVKPLAPPSSSVGQMFPWKVLEHHSEELNTKLIILKDSFALPIYYARLIKGLEKKKENNSTNYP